MNGKFQIVLEDTTTFEIGTFQGSTFEEFMSNATEVIRVVTEEFGIQMGAMRSTWKRQDVETSAFAIPSACCLTCGRGLEGARFCNERPTPLTYEEWLRHLHAVYYAERSRERDELTSYSIAEEAMLTSFREKPEPPDEEAEQ